MSEISVCLGVGSTHHLLILIQNAENRLLCPWNMVQHILFLVSVINCLILLSHTLIGIIFLSLLCPTFCCGYQLHIKGVSLLIRVDFNTASGAMVYS
jgi:hypothetical protein